MRSFSLHFPHRAYIDFGASLPEHLHQGNALPFYRGRHTLKNKRHALFFIYNRVYYYTATQVESKPLDVKARIVTVIE